jgi:multidrug resistance efflux pump
MSKITLKNLFNTPQKWAYFAISLIFIITVYFLVLDRFAPNTDDATLQAYVINVSSYLNGKVEQVYIHENQLVEKNAPLFSLDPKEYELALKKAENNLILTQDQVKEDAQKVEAAQEKLETAKANLTYATTHHEALSSLLAQGAISQDAFNKNAALLVTIKESVNEAERVLAQAKQNLGTSVNGVNIHIIQAENLINAAKLDLSRTTINAPQTGYVTNLQIQKGSFITQGKNAITLIDKQNFWIQANLKENNLNRVHPGQPVLITLNSYPGEIFTGSVDTIGWGVQSPSAGHDTSLPSIEKTNNWVNLAQRFPVKIKFTLPEHHPIRIGTTAIISIQTSTNFIIQALSHWNQWIRAHAQFFY